MQLRYKIFAITCLVIVLMVVLVFLISQLILVKSFNSIEDQGIQSQVGSAVKEINFDLSGLDTTAVNYAYSDDTYAYMSSRSIGYITTYSADSVFENLRLNFMIMVDKEGNVTFEKGYDVKDNRQAAIPRGILDDLGPGSPLNRSGAAGGIDGILMSRDGPLLVSAYPIRATLGVGASRGTLIVGRYLDGDEMTMLRAITSINMTIQPYDGPAAPAPNGSAGPAGLAAGDVAIVPVSGDTISGATTIKDIYGQDALTLTVDMPRSAYQQGQNSVVYMTLAVLLTGLLLGVMTLVLLERTVIARLTRLDQSVVRIGEQDDFSVRVPVEGDDELARFSRTINRTLDAVDRSQRGLHESEQRFRGLVENINDLIWELDGSLRFTYVGPNARQLLKYEPAELLGRGLADMLAPEDAGRMEDMVTAFRRPLGSSGLAEARLADRDGAYVDMEFSGTPILDAGGQIVGYRGAARDIRERRQVEKALRRWADIFEYAKIAIVVCGPDATRFEMANPAFARIYEYAVPDMIGMKATAIVAPECRHQFAESVRKARVDGHCSFESVHLRKDGSRFPAAVDLTVARDSAGNVLYQIINIQDITERKRVERQMMASLQEKEVLLKEIHHRVKNNLQIISSLLNLQSGNLGKGDHAVATAAFRESQDRIKSMALIHEMLYQSKDLAHVDFDGYVRCLVSYLRRSYTPGANVRFAIDIEGVSLGLDTAIPCGLIINELISNSLKYAFAGGRDGQITVALRKEAPGYVLVVGDDGAGLPQGVDFRNSPSLGLQLVNTLVGQIEGTVELADGPGTKFVIRFNDR